MLPPLGPGHHHVDVAAAAPGADEPLAPLRDGGVGAVPLGHLGGVGLDLVAARLALHDQPHARRGGVPEGHRWSRRGFHRSAEAPIPRTPSP